MTAFPQSTQRALKEAPAYKVADNDNNPQNLGRLRRFGDRELEKHDYLIKGLLPKVGSCFLGGQSSSGKTFMGIDLAMSIVQGLPFIERNTRRGGVLWLAAEGAGILEHRIEAARIGKYKCDVADLRGILFEVSPPNKDLNDALANLESAIKIAKSEFDEQPEMPLRLVVVDTLAAYFAIVDENGNAEAGAFMTRINSLAHKWGVTIMLVHHVGKAAESGLRGASAYYAGADAALMVLAEIDLKSGGVSGLRTVALGKSRDGSPGPLASFMIEEAVVGKDIDGDDKKVGFVEFGAFVESGGKFVSRSVQVLMDAIDQALAAHGENKQAISGEAEVRCVHVKHVQQLFNERYTVGEAGDPSEAKRSAYRRAYNQLLKKPNGPFGSAPVGNDEYIWRNAK